MTNTDMRAKLTVTADASALITEMHRGSEGLREMRRETEAAAAAAAQAATEQGRMAERMNRSFSGFGVGGAKSARDSFGIFEAQREYEAFNREVAQQAARSYQALAESMDPVKRAARELAQAQQIVNRALEQNPAIGIEAARTLQQLEDRYQSVVRSQSPAAQSAMAMERAIEEETQAVRQLTLALDPAARATAEMEAVQEQLTRAVRMGITTQEEAARMMSLLEARQKAVGAGGIAMGMGMRMGIQNVSYQFTDILVQLQGGQALSLALAQQLPQLLGGFGALGAVLGLAVAAGVPLVKMLFDLGDGARSLDDRLDALETSLGRVGEHLKILRDENLSHTFGNLTTDIREMTAVLLELERAAELKNLRAAMDGLLKENITPGFGQHAWEVLTASRGAPARSTEQLTRDNYAALTGGRGPDFEAFEARREVIDGLAKAGDVAGVGAEINKLIQDFRDGGPVTEMNDALVQTLLSMGELATKTAEIEAQFNGTAAAAKSWSENVEWAQGLWADAQQRGAEQLAMENERIRIAQNELAIAESVARYGKDSVEAEAERTRVARENYALELDREGIMGANRDRLVEMNDETVRVQDATAVWADRMADVRTEIGGILASLASLGGSVVDRAARAAELQALNAGQTVADAAARGAAVRREAEQKARVAGAGGPVGQVAARLQNWWENAGVEQDAQLGAAREAARERERLANRASRGGSGGGGRDRSSASAGASIMEELARLKPSYENDVAAADAWREKALEGLNRTKDGYARFAADVEEVYQERLKKAYEDDLKRRDDWASGVERGLLKVEDDLGTWADAAENLVTGWAKQGEDAFVRFGMTGKASIGDMVDFMLEQFLRLSFQQNIAPGMNILSGAVTSWIGGMFGGAGSSAPISTNHTGSPGVMRSYNLGGFGDRMRKDEKLAMVRDGEEIMTSRALENASALISNLSHIASQSQSPAVVPVSSGGINMIVNDYSGAGVETEQSTDQRGQPTLTMTIGRQMANAFAQPGNPAGKALTSRYSVKQRGIPR